MVIRWLINADLDNVFNIEIESFNQPWSKTDFSLALRCRDTVGIVVEHKNKILGYAVYVLHKKYIELINLAVATDHLRTGVGTLLLARLKQKINRTCRTRLQTVVQEENFEGLALFKKCGFIITSIHKEYYEEIDGDAYTLQMSLNKEGWQSKPRFSKEHLTSIE